MGTYFLDTSALVKRQLADTGHNWVRALCDPQVGHTIVIAEVALVEVAATYSRMVRETPRRISPTRRDRLIADFEAYVSRQYIVVDITRAVLTRAGALCRVYPLRAYDAVQLASALTRRDDDLAAGLAPPTFVCADVTLLGVAVSEGFAIENSNAHP